MSKLLSRRFKQKSNTRTDFSMVTGTSFSRTNRNVINSLSVRSITSETNGRTTTLFTFFYNRIQIKL